MKNGCVLILLIPFVVSGSDSLKDLATSTIVDVIATKKVSFNEYIKPAPDDIVNHVKEKFVEKFGHKYNPEELQDINSHDSTVSALKFGPQSLFSGSEDKTIAEIDIVTGKVKKKLPIGASTICTLELNKKGNKLYSGDHAGNLKVFSIAEGICLNTLNTDISISSIVPFRKIVAFGSSSISERNSDITLINKKNFKLLKQLKGHTKSVMALAIANNSLISVSEDGTVKLWDIDKMEQTATLNGHANGIMDLKCNKAFNVLHTSSRDNSVKTWDPRTNTAVSTLNGHDRFVNKLALNPNDIYLYSGSRDKNIKVWDLRMQKNLHTIPSGKCSIVHSLEVTHDTLLSGSDNGAIKRWKVAQNFEEAYKKIN